MSVEIWNLEKDLCRCCHTEGSFDNLAEPKTYLEKVEIYSDMLRDCFDIEIAPVPGELCTMTYKICEACILRLRYAVTFKKQVQDCEERFMELYYKNAIKALNNQQSSKSVVKEELSESFLIDLKEEDISQMDHHDEDDEDEDDDDDFDLKEDEDEQNSDEDILVINKQKLKTKEKLKIEKPKMKRGRPRKIKEEKRKEAVKEKKGKDNSIDEHYTIKKDTDGSQLYACKTCSNVFKKRDFFKQHYRHVHLKQRPKLIGCYYCEEKVAAHMRAHHLEKVHGVPAPSCGACGKKFSFPFQVLRHQKTYHMGEKKFACVVCDKTFASRGNLAQHEVKHSTARPFKCDSCDETFKWKKHLRRHMMTHTNMKRN
ncbi:zinc finger protein 184-like isoform X2 [Nymphalis io]|uniref:zinc finger protein 184-like isoform X2 n=1 Tax=Inachis io TaxID=171585 RepID=UPI00216A144C|nr:zinc finger protein 184-like isoform X2 [Nymphalis io]